MILLLVESTFLWYNNRMMDIKDMITENIGDNINYYRKQFNMTQLELSEKLNYSDKSISKWERKEGIPDIFVISELADFFGVSIDDFVKKKRVSTKHFKKKQLIAYFYALIIWLVMGVTYGVLKLFEVNYNSWHLFIYALPLSSLVLFVFNLVYKKIHYIFIYFTISIWTLALSLDISFPSVKGYLFYIITIPIYIFCLYFFFLIFISKKRKRDKFI